MSRLNSLVDLLKQNLYFTEGLTVKELLGFIHQRMLQDYSEEEVKKLITSCLKSTECFYSGDGNLWYIEKKGLRENDSYYNKLFKEQMPLKFNDIRERSTRAKKKKEKVIKLAIDFVSDGRFVQHSGGKWGLTEWEVDSGQYRLRHLVIKVLSKNPEGLSLQEIVEKLDVWRKIPEHTVLNLLNRFPYFLLEEGLWTYSAKIRNIYADLTEKRIASLRRQKLRFFEEKKSLKRKVDNKELVLNEIRLAKEQVAAALTEQAKFIDDYEHIVQRFAEKDLLLTLRKRELIKSKHENQKLERKANSILKECRKWYNEYKNTLQENEWLIKEAKYYKDERDEAVAIEENLREEIFKLKDNFASEKADLIRENINIKHQIEKSLSRSKKEEKLLKSEISRLGTELKRVLQESEERRYSLEMAEERINEFKKELRKLKTSLRNPIVRIGLKLANMFAR